MYKIIQTVYTNYLNIQNNMPSMIYAIAQKLRSAPILLGFRAPQSPLFTPPTSTRFNTVFLSKFCLLF